LLTYADVKDDVIANREIDFTKNETYFPQSSRIFVQISQFKGQFSLSNVLKKIREIGHVRYNFTNNNLMVFSSVGVYLEQIYAVPNELFAIFFFLIESIILFSMLLTFNLQIVFVMVLMVCSFVVSVSAFFLTLGMSFNFVTLVELIILPAFISEFIFYSPYLFLFKTLSNNNNTAANENETDSIYNGNEMEEFKDISFSQKIK
jgi:hypothetical protein